MPEEELFRQQLNGRAAPEKMASAASALLMWVTLPQASAAAAAVSIRRRSEQPSEKLASAGWH